MSLNRPLPAVLFSAALMHPDFCTRITCAQSTLTTICARIWPKIGVLICISWRGQGDRCGGVQGRRAPSTRRLGPPRTLTHARTWMLMALARVRGRSPPASMRTAWAALHHQPLEALSAHPPLTRRGLPPHGNGLSIETVGNSSSLWWRGVESVDRTRTHAVGNSTTLARPNYLLFGSRSTCYYLYTLGKPVPRYYYRDYPG